MGGLRRRAAADIPLPWERVLWRGGPAFSVAARERYWLTDFRVIRESGGGFADLVLHDIGEVACTSSRVAGAGGLSTIVIRPRDPRRPPITLRRIRRGPQLAALLELLAGEPAAALDTASVAAALAWSPQPRSVGFGGAVSAFALALVAVFAIVAALHGTTVPPASYAADDPLYPGGHKRDRAEILQFMREEVMPWARPALAAVVGGADRVTCETCHGHTSPGDVDWVMPAVAALPQPDLRDQGWEHYGGALDAQMRNAIYGYLAQPDKQSTATYMREVVMPGMARLLHRPAYDFTRTYAFNRSQLAFGCYHCHRVN